MPRKNKEDYTSIGLKKTTKESLHKLKKYPRETDDETLIRIIKKEVAKNVTKNKDVMDEIH